MKNSPSTLPAGYLLQEYVILSTLSIGGFGIVYLAQDKLGALVAIKEYMPKALAMRTADMRVEPSSEHLQNQFQHGLKCFFEEAMTLTKIKDQHIVKVLNFFKANQTVYMVMQYEVGLTLQDYVLTHTGHISEVFMRYTFSRVLRGLRKVHSLQMLHLDIKPANIYVRKDKSPVLLDFGSARQGLNESKAKLALCYTPGFAAPEQYTDRKLMGPWTDLYSVGTTMYACLSRSTPLSAQDRLENDTLVPAQELGRHHYSQSLLKLIDDCLILDHLARPQSVMKIEAALVGAYEPIAQVSMFEQMKLQYRLLKQSMRRAL